LKVKQRKLSKVQGDINTCLGRIKNSTSETFLAEQRDRLVGLLTLSHSAIAFQGLLISTTAEPETYFELKELLMKAGFTIGRAYEEYELVLRGRQAMMRNDIAGLLLLCKGGSPHMTKLRIDGFAKH